MLSDHSSVDAMLYFTMRTKGKEENLTKPAMNKRPNSIDNGVYGIHNF
jgi:hypothetical protein